MGRLSCEYLLLPMCLFPQSRPNGYPVPAIWIHTESTEPRPGVPSQWIREKARCLLLCDIYPSHLPLRSIKDNIHPLNLVSSPFLVTS